MYIYTYMRVYFLLKVSTTSITKMFIQTHTRTDARNTHTKRTHACTYKHTKRTHAGTYKHTKRTHAGTYKQTQMHKTRARLFSLNMIFVIILYNACIAFLLMNESVMFALCYNNVHEHGIKETKVSKKTKYDICSVRVAGMIELPKDILCSVYVACFIYNACSKIHDDGFK